MRAVLFKLGCLGILGLALIGCRTMEPELKPADEPEVLRTPPEDPRYNSPKYPREAFNDSYDPLKKLTAPTNQQGMPSRGFGGPGAGPGIQR